MYYIYKLCGYPPDVLAVFAGEESYKVDLAIHYGLVPVLMNWTWLGLVPTENLGDSKIEEKARKTVEKAKVVDESVLPLRIRGYIEFAKRLAEILGIRVEVKAVYGDNFYDPQAKLVGLSIRELEKPVMALGAIVHEIAHAYGDARYGSAPDISENFERALTYVAGYALHFMHKSRGSVSRALNGGFKAVYHWSEYPKDKLEDLLADVIVRIVKKYGVKPENPVGATVLTIARELLPSLDDPPAYIIVRLRVGMHDIYVDEVYRGASISSYNDRTYEKYMEAAEKEAMEAFRSLRQPDKPILALVYDPSKDEYKIVAEENVS